MSGRNGAATKALEESLARMVREELEGAQDPRDSSGGGRPGCVFVVFVDSLMNVRRWDVENADPEDRAAPAGARSRFGGLVWAKR